MISLRLKDYVEVRHVPTLQGKYLLAEVYVEATIKITQKSISNVGL